MSDKVTVTMPDVGAGRWPVKVSTWLVSLGDHVRKGDRLVELSLPGVTFDVNAPTTGVLASIEIPSGSIVTIGDRLATIVAPSPDDDL